MTPVATRLETVTLVAPVGLQFWDPVTNTPVRSGLEVWASPVEVPSQITYGVKGRTTGIFSFAHLPGMRDFESGGAPGISRRYNVTVFDVEGRFLPMQFTLPLPETGLTAIPCLPPLSPPEGPQQSIPLFSSPARFAPPGMAVLRADVWDATANAPAAWALLELTLDGNTYRGLADAGGKVMMIVPYPEPALPSGIVLSPPQISPGSQTWNLRLQAFYQPLRRLPAIPDLCDALNQPPAPLWSDSTLTNPIPTLTLTFGRELIVRSRNASNGGLLSTLLLTPVASPLDHL